MRPEDVVGRFAAGLAEAGNFEVRCVNDLVWTVASRGCVFRFHFEHQGP